MRFTVGHHIYFEANRPASHATLFGPSGDKLPFVNEASSFNDAERKYSWAFRRPELVVNDVYVFACVEFTCAGKVNADGGIDVLVIFAEENVERGEGGKPLAVNLAESRSAAKRKTAPEKVPVTNPKNRATFPGTPKPKSKTKKES